VVGLSNANDESVTLADVQDTLRALVVAMETIDDGQLGYFTAVDAWTVKVAGATVRGNYLAKSSTTKALYDTGVSAATNPPPTGAVAIALTGSGGAGTVIGLLLTSGSSGNGGALFNGGNVASAATLPVGNTGSFFHVTGGTGITAISTRPSGHLLVLVFDGTPTLTHSASLVLQGDVNKIASAGEILMFVSEGAGTWRQIALDAQVLAGLRTGFVQIGTPATAAGSIRAAAGFAVHVRNNANSDDQQLLSHDANDRLALGAGAHVRVINHLRLDIDATARLIVPVGADKF
jgi:hypothetical protein